jgi:hypothetical protein
MDIIRVLRVIEYEGPRDWVEKAVARSIHGEKRINGGVIRGATLGVVAEILGEVPVPGPPMRQPGDYLMPNPGITRAGSCHLCLSWPNGCGGDNTRAGCEAAMQKGWEATLNAPLSHGN